MIVNVDPIVSANVCSPVFLGLTICREAEGASLEAKLGVGYSILNRVERGSWWGKRLDDVLFKKWQYSSMTAPGDPGLVRWFRFDYPPFLESLAVARAVLGKTEPNPFPGADSYYDSSLDRIGKAPNWIATARHCGDAATVGANTLRFFDVDHDFEAPVTGHA